jgi:predicted Holliday junction resolvase-like endonuclease
VDALTLAALAVAALGWAAAWFMFGRWRSERAARKTTESRKIAQSTRYGQITEQFAPWMHRWPFASTKGFRFLGDPIDGVHFEGDAVYLVEIKAADGELGKGQRAIREAVREGRVGWVEFRVSEDEEPTVIRPWETRTD